MPYLTYFTFMLRYFLSSCVAIIFLLLFFFLSSPSCLFSRYLFLFSHYILPISLHPCHPCYPLMLSSVSLYSYPSFRISSVFLSPVMLSSLPSYPSRLISSHFLFILSSISPVCQSSYFTDCLSETVLPKQCTKCHFKKPTSNSCCSPTILSF